MNQLIDAIIEQISKVLLDKEHQVKLALTCLLSKGHLLIEDLPGMGKTTLAQCLSQVLGLQYERVQFTSDLLPADILGVSIFDRNKSEFTFHRGPIFTQVLLADEINRSTPKTQSALLEAMEEKQVTVEGDTRALPTPFFVIATQNPNSQAGTYPLPESQLDRFLLRISLGYPSKEAERLLFNGTDPRLILKNMSPVISVSQLEELQLAVDTIKVSDQLLDYLQRLVHFTRNDGVYTYGLSPRGAIAFLKAAKAWALIHNREFVVPEDLQKVAPAVLGHRIRGTLAQSGSNLEQIDNPLVQHLLSSVDVVGT